MMLIPGHVCHYDDPSKRWKQNKCLHMTIMSVLNLSHHVKKTCFVCSAFVSMTVRSAEKSLLIKVRNPCLHTKPRVPSRKLIPVKCPCDSTGWNKPRGQVQAAGGAGMDHPSSLQSPRGDGMREWGGGLWQRAACRSPLQYIYSLSARSQPKQLLTPGRQRGWPAQGMENCQNQT